MKATLVSYLKAIAVLLLSLYWTSATAQPVGEAGEPSPEQRDAAFTREDAAAEAAAFSDTIIAPDAVDPVQAMTDAANLVFRGSVRAQSYVYDAHGTPYTQTTFAIAAILKGSAASDELTLLQEGGPAQDGSDNVLLVSSSEHFTVGDEELLFLELDTDNPVAHQRAVVKHRFRILGDKVYSGDGRGIIVEQIDGGPGRRLLISDDRHPSEYFRRIQIGAHTLTRNFRGDVAGTDDVRLTGQADLRTEPAAHSYTGAVDVETFSAAINRTVQEGERP